MNDTFNSLSAASAPLHIEGTLHYARMDRARRAAQSDEVETAAKEMEGLFATMLVKELRSTLSAGLFGEGPGTDVFNGWFDDTLGKSLADSGALDLVGTLKAALGGGKAASEDGAARETEKQD